MRNPLHFFPARILAGAAVALVALASGCSYLHGPEPLPEPAPSAYPCGDAAPATYTAVISPIFEAHCRKCHGDSYQTDGGGNDYRTYQGIKKQLPGRIMGCIQHDPSYDPMPKGDPKLSDCDIARIKSWIDAGQPNN